jgi:hypothetical protein
MDVPQLTIEVASRPEAGDILVSPQRCAQITCLVSIGDSHDKLPAGYENVARKLRLLVADVVTELGATEEDILRIIRLAEGLRSDTAGSSFTARPGSAAPQRRRSSCTRTGSGPGASRRRWSGCYRSALSRSRIAG